MLHRLHSYFYVCAEERAIRSDNLVADVTCVRLSTETQHYVYIQLLLPNCEGGTSRQFTNVPCDTFLLSVTAIKAVLCVKFQVECRHKIFSISGFSSHFVFLLLSELSAVTMTMAM